MMAPASSLHSFPQAARIYTACSTRACRTRYTLRRAICNPCSKYLTLRIARVTCGTSTQSPKQNSVVCFREVLSRFVNLEEASLVADEKDGVADFEDWSRMLESALGYGREIRLLGRRDCLL